MNSSSSAESIPIAVIGGGNLGRAFASALVSRGISSPGDLLIVERYPAVCREIGAALGARTAETIGPEIGSARLVLLAVKPQDAAEACAALRRVLRGEQILVSVMAGVSAAVVSRLSGHARVVRCMPNLPATVGAGVSAYHLPPGMSEADHRLVLGVLSACGETVRLDHEELLDAATAVSGSGPAYCFYFLEQLIAAGVELGLSEDESRKLTAATVRGSLELWESRGTPLGELRKQVTSRGGTTAAAFGVLDERAWGGALREAVSAARRRAAELRAELEGKLS